MRDNLTLVTVILDRSGSMKSHQGAMQLALDGFIKEQKAEPGDCRLTFVQFDSQYEVVADYIDMQQAKDQYPLVPRGNTALLDALGRTVTDVGAKLAALPEWDRPGKVVFVVITDGLENASHQWTKPNVDGLVRMQRETYKWQFIYLGANQDAIAEGVQMGFLEDNSMTFDTSYAGAAAMATSVGMHTNSYRRASYPVGANIRGFTEDERKRAVTQDGNS